MLMPIATLSFSGTSWLWPALGFLVVASLTLFWTYRTVPDPRLRGICFGLKLAALVALAACLLEPRWFGQRARPGANLFAVVADNSQGMQIHDRGDSRTRGDFLRSLVDQPLSGWQATLAATFDVRRYLVDTRLQPTRDFQELAFDGRASSLGLALRTLEERFQGRPLAGILLLTDGNATDLRGSLPDWAGLPPVYPVVIGRREPARDLSVANVHLSQTVFEDAPVTLQADIVASGFRGRPVSVQLVDQRGQTLQEQTAEGRPDGETLPFRFQVKPEQAGLSFYQIRVASRDAATTAGGETPEAEATLVNNTRVVPVHRGQGPYRILYVAGRPNWEYKFLNRAIDDDPEVELVALIRVAKREPKFDFLGRAGETSNPLYRGFGDQSPEEVQRYDQPVLVRLNTRDETELSKGFPRTPEDLYGYHAVILDDLEAEFFTPDQATLLQKFVSERGGGFIMLGGMESLREGGYLRTPIGDLLPVYLDGEIDELPAPAASRWQLTREGWLQAWARMRDNEPGERARLDSMPAFQVVNRVRALKPGASAIATIPGDQDADLPALAVQRFGRGRSAALMIGDLWRWGMKDASAQADLAKTWRQLLRWLIADVPGRVELTVAPQPDDSHGAMELQVRVRDATHQPMDDAVVTVEIQSVGLDASATGDSAPLRLLAEPSLEEAGRYHTTYVPRQSGGYRATAVVTNSAGAEIGRAEAGWSTDLAAEEFRSLTPNRALLTEIARRTGGELVEADDLAAFARRLPERRAPAMETWSYPLWHTPAMLIFALACLLVEWGLRRRKGLA